MMLLTFSKTHGAFRDLSVNSIWGLFFFSKNHSWFAQLNINVTIGTVAILAQGKPSG